MPSGNGDEPIRSSRSAPKGLLHGLGKGLAPSPLSLSRIREADLFTASFPIT